jgi:16S rRNA C1402 N4-methylase RsmH
MNQEDEIQQIAQIFVNLGAEQTMARQMARQLIKRAEQRSHEEDISKTEALKELLEVAVYGAQGMLKPSDEANFDTKKG